LHIKDKIVIFCIDSI